MSKRPEAPNAREVSFLILDDYFSEKGALNAIIENRLADKALSPINRRFVFEIVKGTVRFYIKIDYLISLFSNRPLKKIDIKLLNILRLSVYQLLFMTRVPAYSIVDQGVRIAKKYSGSYSSGFINAILRKISAITDLASYLENSIEEKIHDNKEKLKIEYSFPMWIIEYWMKSYGFEKTESILKQLNKNPRTFVRVNKIKSDKNTLIGLFKQNGLIQGVDFDPIMDFKKSRQEIFDDVILLKSSQDLERFPGFNSGYFSIQDFSSQLAVKYFLEPLPGEKILDICGAPGGKATFIAELTGDDCKIDSVDINENKIGYFNDNIARLGLKSIRILKTDVTCENFLKKEEIYDKIFVDLPCSSLGTISKNPDVKYNKSPEDINRLSAQSRTILNNCKKYLREKGRMVVYTCTLSKKENYEVIEDYIKKNPDMFIVEISIPQILLRYINRENIKPVIYENTRLFEILPYYFNSEGGSVAIIEKKL